MKIAVIGAGNGGQAIAGHMASMGHEVSVYDRDAELVAILDRERTIRLEGALTCEGRIALATTDVAKAVKGAEIIMVATTATAHAPVARDLAPHIEEGQVIVLNPGRTCGALEFDNVLKREGVAVRYYLAEAQTLVYACRLKHPCLVNIIGVKDRVLMAALPSADTDYVIERLKPMYTCFYPAANVLATSFENIGAMFHPCVVLFNEAAIERGHQFYFYRDMTPGLAHLIETADAERLAVAHAYGCHPIPASDWVAYAYTGVEGDTLCERMQNNPAYYEILAPTTIECRQITEDIPTGIIPLAELGRAAGVETPLFDSITTLCSILLKRDFRAQGRTLENLGLDGKTAREIMESIR